jgi:hypothetical protein
MSTVKILGSSTGTANFTVTVPSGTSTDRTLTLPDSTGTIALQGGAGVGKVLQVVQTIKTDTFVTAATVTDTPVTGLSVSITPSSSSSRVFVQVELGVTAENGQGSAAKLRRNGTFIGLADAAGSRSRSSFGGSAYRGSGTGYLLLGWGLSTAILDSPATTSAITYDVVVSSLNTGTYVNRAGDDTDSNDRLRWVSTITAWEIAA